MKLTVTDLEDGFSRVAYAWEIRDENMKDAAVLEALDRLESGASKVERVGCMKLETREDDVVAREPNGSRTERTTRDALAEFGARVLEILQEHASGESWTSRQQCEAGLAAHFAARSLGLLEGS